MSILITGGLGHIGSHLAKELRKRGYPVVVSDLKIISQDGYERGDVCSFVEMHRIFKEYNIKHVYHFAGEVGRENGELFPRRCVDVNVSGTLNLIQLCIEHGACLYFASTSEVYGDLAGKYKLTEDLLDRYPAHLTNCYAISKLHAEHYIRHFVEHYNLRALSFRFFMCYGDGEWPSPMRSAISNFIYRALTDQPIIVHRNTYRSWCYIEDIVRGCIMAMENFKNNGYQVYNIGRDDLWSMEEVANLVCDLTHKMKSLIKMEDHGWLVTPKKDASFEKAERELGYKSEISQEEGVRRTIAWQKEYVLE
ncbi:MAG: NAD-dependent epimerase/dehydratase family protein [Candidatus Aminicenantaceae bacterium]